jgi:hypothetical protein
MAWTNEAASFGNSREKAPGPAQAEPSPPGARCGGRQRHALRGLNPVAADLITTPAAIRRTRAALSRQPGADRAARDLLRHHKRLPVGLTWPVAARPMIRLSPQGAGLAPQNAPQRIGPRLFGVRISRVSCVELWGFEPQTNPRPLACHESLTRPATRPYATRPGQTPAHASCGRLRQVLPSAIPPLTLRLEMISMNKAANLAGNDRTYIQIARPLPC